MEKLTRVQAAKDADAAEATLNNLEEKKQKEIDKINEKYKLDIWNAQIALKKAEAVFSKFATKSHVKKPAAKRVMNPEE